MSLFSIQTLGGSPLSSRSGLKVASTPRGAPPEQYPEGRRCRRCRAKLNIYNKHDVCTPCRQKGLQHGGMPLTGGETKRMLG